MASAPGWDWDRERPRDRDRERDRERDRDRDRPVRDRGERDRDREQYEQNGHAQVQGHGHGRPRSTVIQGSASGSGSGVAAGGGGVAEIGSSIASSFRKDSSSYDQHHPEGGRGDRDHLDREDRFSDAGADTIFISNLPEAADEDSLVALLNDTGAIKVNGKTGAPMVRVYRDKTGLREAEVVLDDPRTAPGLVNWYNGYDFKGSKIQVSLGHPAQGSNHDRRAGSYGNNYDHDGPPHVRTGGYRGGRGRGRHGDRFPHPSQAMSGMGRGFMPFPRDMDGGFGGPGDIPHGGESFGRNNPNVTPREGDWICPEPTCGNLNFARRTHCNNCNKSRRDLAGGIGGVADSPGSFRAPLPHVPFMGSPIGRGMGRGLSGFGGPSPVWGQGPPRPVDAGPMGRMSDFRGGRHSRDRDDVRERDDIRERDDFRDRGDRFDRLPFEKTMFGGGHIDRDRDRFRDRRLMDNEARGDRRPGSPRGRWGRDIRERSRSPPPRGDSREYHHKSDLMYMDRRRDERRDDRRDRKDDHH